MIDRIAEKMGWRYLPQFNTAWADKPDDELQCMAENDTLTAAGAVAVINKHPPDFLLVVHRLLKSAAILRVVLTFENAVRDAFNELLEGE